MRTLASIALLAACGHVTQDPDTTTDAAPMADDADASGTVARCDPSKAFAVPTPVPGVNSVDDELGFTMTRDEQTGFIERAIQNPIFAASILTTTRTGPTATFTTPTQMLTEALNTMDGDEFAPYPTLDARTLYFARQYIPGDPLYLLATSRDDTVMPYGGETTLTFDGSAMLGTSPRLSDDDQTLYYIDLSLYHLWAVTRDGSPSQFQNQRELSTGPVFNPVLSADERTMYYSVGAEVDILVATRPDKATPFGVGVPVDAINSTANDAPLFLTADGCVLYLKTNRPGGVGGIDIWESRRPR